MSTEPRTSPTTDPTTPQHAGTPDRACACWSRRESLAVAGLAAAGAARPRARRGRGGDAVSSAASAASQAIKAADIPVGGGKVFDRLKVVVTQPTAGDFKAFTAICTHQGCTVQDVANGVIT